jgi:protein SFI1
MSSAKVRSLLQGITPLMCTGLADTLRRMFIKWLTAARKSRTRRTRLAEREDEVRLKTLSTAWEAWRDHFREIRLRDLASYML